VPKRSGVKFSIEITNKYNEGEWLSGVRGDSGSRERLSSLFPSREGNRQKEFNKIWGGGMNGDTEGGLGSRYLEK